MSSIDSSVSRMRNPVHFKRKSAWEKIKKKLSVDLRDGRSLRGKLFERLDKLSR